MMSMTSSNVRLDDGDDELLLEELSANVAKSLQSLNESTGKLKDGVQTSREAWSISSESLAALAARRPSGTAGRIVAVGTTTVRVLESLPDPLPDSALADRTNLMIAPPWNFRHVDALLTNFHLPHSTLLALVAAMIGIDRLRSAYDEAIARGYRFYSYGDAMLIL